MNEIAIFIILSISVLSIAFLFLAHSIRIVLDSMNNPKRNVIKYPGTTSKIKEYSYSSWWKKILSEYFGKKIYVEIDSELVEFKSDAVILKLSPYVTIQRLENSKYSKILEIGNPENSSNDGITIGLFKKQKDESIEYNKSEFLGLFFRYGFKKTLPVVQLFRPEIIFMKTKFIRDYYNGYHELVLGHAAINAGAWKYKFE